MGRIVLAYLIYRLHSSRCWGLERAWRVAYKVQMWQHHVVLEEFAFTPSHSKAPRKVTAIGVLAQPSSPGFGGRVLAWPQQFASPWVCGCDCMWLWGSSWDISGFFSFYFWWGSKRRAGGVAPCSGPQKRHCSSSFDKRVMTDVVLSENCFSLRPIVQLPMDPFL